MRFYRLILIVLLLGVIGFSTNKAIKSRQRTKITSWIDNQGYWTMLAAKGIVPYNPEIINTPAVFSGSSLRATTVSTTNSPDIAVAGEGNTQSENSVFIDPFDETRVINSNNSTNFPIDTAFGANSLHSFDAGTTWQGSIEGAGGFNNGDPSTVIGLNGRWYVNYLGTDFSAYVSYSDDEGQNWQVVDVANHPLIECDKNHMWIDNNPDSPYEGNIYISWTNTSDLDLGEIAMSYSTDGGLTWNLNTNISAQVDAGSHNQGVNITSGPDGEVYAVWAVYDSWQSGGSDEVALGLSKSLDGGQTWEPAKRIITNIRGIRATRTSKNMRVNSFPVATVDNSNGADRGALYVTWSNIGEPGQNTGNDINIYLIKSFDKGNTFSEPVKVNGDESGVGNEHFFPWITCDRSTGILSMVYYDDRNVGGAECEVFCANSIDGGQTWDEFKVSDVSFTPSPIPGLAADYMGDYLGITALNGHVFPIWTDNRLGYAMTFCSPYQTNPLQRPENLSAVVNEQTGDVLLSWEYAPVQGFSTFIIYRDGDSISSTTDMSFTDLLPAFGKYRYRVTAYYDNGQESGATGVLVKWGSPSIQLLTDSIYDHLAIGQSSEHSLFIKNTGQLPLNYRIGLSESQKSRDYCQASGGGGDGNEYISSVEIGDISNLNSGSDNYTYYSELSTSMRTGYDYEITVTNGQPFDLDKCGVWVDWNINGIFEEEELTTLSGSTLSPFYTGVISPPPGTITGQSRMRVRLQYSGVLSPCGSTYFGEVEDYTIHLQGWLDVNPVSDTIQPADSNSITISFNSSDIPVDDYYTNLQIISNDEQSGILYIPIHLRTDHLLVGAQASDSIVCPGTKIDLMPLVHGVFDSLTYLWTSNPPGYSTNLSRPIAIILAPTWYIIKIQDGDHFAVDSVFVDTYQQPVFDLGNDTLLCADANILLDAGEDGIDYLWSTGENTRYILVDSSGTGYGNVKISVEVLNEYGCKKTDKINIDFVDCTSVPEVSTNYFQIFPNPSAGVFTIKSSFVESYNEITMLSSTGKVVYHKYYFGNNSHTDHIIEVPDVKSGRYTLVIKTNSRSFNISHIIIK